ncbi:hypothetical protein [Pseudomarimonas arenosa]|uniref:Solute-binding protein family 3/N-terminal domain-containing protein n=1 Tax=Pseudomarimonas arenosa TaxID=2774145 RepID=A0AAW3ZJ30_9GAMM|nr:hypothetical protein [Pseudomarimonas arenosa]MBD8525991.1 hypothetical protein [Pseudomarimonas arenosa]
MPFGVSGRILLWLSGLLLAPVLWAAPIRLCHNQQLSGLADREPAFLLINLLQADNPALSFEQHSLPWLRCLAMVAAGEMDAALAASHTAERGEGLRFPLDEQGLPDHRLRMYRLGYLFLRPKDAVARWNGRSFMAVERPIGVQRGHAIADYLRTLGVAVDDGTSDADALLAKLNYGRLDGIAVSQPHWRDLMAQPAWAEKLEPGGPALMQRDYFLAFSSPFVERDSERAQRIWTDIARWRESAEFRRAFAHFLGMSTSDLNASP